MASEQSPRPRLCANGCGFFSRPETNNLCSKCYRETCRDGVLKQQASTAVSATPDSFRLGAVAAGAVDSSTIAVLDEGLKHKEESTNHVKSKDQCGSCNKKVGLVKGFKCRCGNMYCSAHRYPEEHKCTFDFKAAGRDLLVKANPRIQADKLERRI